jgi:hypothetical protein
MHLDASFSGAGQSGSLSADGEFDGDQGEVTLNVGDLLGTTGLSGGDQLKLIVTKDGDHPVVYLRLPELATLLPGGKEWTKLDLEEAMSTLGVGGSAKDLFGAAGQSPADALKLLERVGNVTEVGRETIDGAETTHYRATVDVEEALKSAGAPPEAIAAVQRAGIDTNVPVDVWIGVDDGYVHRLHLSYGTDVAGQKVGGELTMTLSDWGADVNVDVPSDDQVLDATKLLSQLHP